MWWFHAGAAPVYVPYILSVRTGDAVYESFLCVPETLQPGNYRLCLALLDPRTGASAIALAIQGRQPDGWCDLGAVEATSPLLSKD